MTDALLTLPEAAAFARVCTKTLRAMVRKRMIRAKRVGVRGHDLRFYLPDLLQDLERQPALHLLTRRAPR